MQYQRDYLSATQELKHVLDGRVSKRKPEDLLEEVKLVVSPPICTPCPSQNSTR